MQHSNFHAYLRLNFVACRPITAWWNFHPMEVASRRKTAFFMSFFFAYLLWVENSQRKFNFAFAARLVAFLASHHQPLVFRALLVHSHVNCATLSLPIVRNFPQFLLIFTSTSAATRKTFSPFARKIENEKVLSNRRRRELSFRESDFPDTNTSKARLSDGKFIEGNFTGWPLCEIAILRDCHRSLLILTFHESRHKFSPLERYAVLWKNCSCRIIFQGSINGREKLP